MLVLGLDPSLRNYGWCIINTDDETPIVVEKGRWQTGAKQLFIERYIYLRESIFKLCTSHDKVRCVGIESPPFGEIWSEGLYGLFLYAIEALYLARKNVFFWDPSTVKSRAREITGHTEGKMFKSDMIAAAKKLSGFKKWNNDEADAFHVAHITSRFVKYTLNELAEADLTKKEKWIFTGTKVNKKTGVETKRGMIFREDERFFRFGDEI